MPKVDIADELLTDLKNLQRAIKETYGERPNLNRTSEVYAKIRKKPRNKSLGEIIKKIFGD